MKKYRVKVTNNYDDRVIEMVIEIEADHFSPPYGAMIKARNKILTNSELERSKEPCFYDIDRYLELFGINQKTFGVEIKNAKLCEASFYKFVVDEITE
jgi:hypothetical protein